MNNPTGMTSHVADTAAVYRTMNDHLRLNLLNKSLSLGRLAEVKIVRTRSMDYRTCLFEKLHHKASKKSGPAGDQDAFL